MKKRILSLLLVLLMVASLVPTAVLAARGDNDIAYPVTNGNIYFDSYFKQITDCDKSVTVADIPKQIGGVDVRYIGTGAFYKCTNLTSVTIPDSVTGIRNSAFSGCTGLTDVTIPNSVTDIGNFAFSDCTGLTSITIPSSVTNIGNYVFQYCEKLTEINAEEDNSAYSSDDGVLLNKTQTMLKNCPEGKNGEYIIPKTVTEIRDNAFKNCSSLTNVMIANSVKSIGESAFENCSSLTSITIPNGVTSVGYNAFYECKNLISVTIPNSVTTIGDFTFSDCSSLSNVAIPDSVTSIDKSAFLDCDIEDVYYAGSEAEWKEVSIQSGNYYLTRARIHYGGTMESHIYTDIVTEPTCTERGYTTHTCTCGISYVDSYTNALGHDYKNGECTRCGEKDPNAAAPSFVDVPSTSYCYDAVQWAVENGVTAGTDTTHFSPNAGCTRAQVVTFLWRAAGKPIVETDVSFTDVSTGAYYYEAVKWAVANGITAGTDAAHFSPNATCTRGQVVTFLYRAAKSPSVSTVSSFSDVAAGSYCYNAVSWAVANGITAGTGGNRFSPNATCTRGQVVTFLYRAQ